MLITCRESNPISIYWPFGMVRRSTSKNSSRSGFSSLFRLVPSCPFCPPGLRFLPLVFFFEPRLRAVSFEGGMLLFSESGGSALPCRTNHRLALERMNSKGTPNTKDMIVCTWDCSIFVGKAQTIRMESKRDDDSSCWEPPVTRPNCF